MGESAQHASLRPVVARIDRELARLAACEPAEVSAAVGELRVAWGRAVALLALGPAPELRECPACRRKGMRAATVCGFCWTRLSPVAEGRGELSPVEACDGG